MGIEAHDLRLIKEAADRQEQLAALWASDWAAQRPVVYPFLTANWPDAGHQYLPLKNGGRGPALNMRGILHERRADGTTQGAEINAGTIAAGDTAKPNVPNPPGIREWAHVEGRIQYGDLADGHHETHFSFDRTPPRED